MGRVSDLFAKTERGRLTAEEHHELGALLDSLMSNMGKFSPWAMPGSGVVREGPGIDITGSNRIGVGHDSILLADSSTNVSAREYAATSAGLIAALAAATSGDTILLPSLNISGGPWTVGAGVDVVGMGYNSILTGNITNAGLLFNLKTAGNTTNNKHAYFCMFTASSGNNVLLGSNSAIFWCEVNGGAYGVNIPSGTSNGTVYYSRVYNATTAGLYCDSSTGGAGFSRFEGANGGDVRDAELVEHCHFVGTGTDGLIHPSGTAEFLSCSFILEGGAGYGLNLDAGATLTDCYWESIDGIANITYGAGDRAPRNPSYLTLGTDGNIDNERVLTGTANQIVLADNGAGSTLVLSLPQDIHTGATPTFAGLTINGTLDTDGFIGATVEKSSGYTATASDFAIMCDASGGGFTITLPAAASHTGRVYHIKKIDSSGNIVTVDGNSSETIDDATTAVLTTQYESITIQSDGDEWFIL